MIRRVAQNIFSVFVLVVAACSPSEARHCATSDDCGQGEFCIAATCAAANGREVSVAVTAPPGIGSAPPSVLLNTTKQFSAVVSGVAEQGVTWSVEAAGGVIGPDGDFTAQHSGTWHLVAQSKADRSKSGTLEVLVPAIETSSSPKTVALPVGRTQQFTVAVANAVDPSIRWEVVEPDGGSISPDGLYTAPAAAQTPATFHVRATSNEDPARTSISTVVVYSLDIVVSPATAALQLGGRQAFATASQPVFWSVREPGGGQIDQDGDYTAPESAATPQTVHIVATSRDDATRSAVAEVTIAPVVLTVSPAAASVRFGTTLQLAATVANAPDSRVFWALQERDAGTVSQSGLYSAPGGSGVRTNHVAARSFADSTKMGIAEITVDLRPAIASFAATPAVALPGAATTLSWSVEGAETISIDPGVGDVTGTSSVEVHPAVTTTYTLRATNSQATVTRAVTVQVATGVPAISTFAASAGRILPGAKSTLSWTVTGADTVDIEPGIGRVPATSSIDVSPAMETQYTLTATNAHGQSTAIATVQLARFRVTAPLAIPRQTGWVDLGDGFGPAPSQSQNIMRLLDGTSLLIGGMFWQYASNNELFGPIAVASAEIFDPAANTGEGGFTAIVQFPGDPTSTPPFQEEADGFAVVQLPSGQVLTAGPNFELFDPATRSFQPLGVNLAGVKTSATVLPDGRVALLGASGPFIYDPSTAVSTEAVGTGCSLANAGVPILLPSGKILLPGIQGGCIAELWDPATPAGTLAFTVSQAGLSPGFTTATNDFLLQNGKVLIDSFTVYDPATDSIVENIRPSGFFTQGEPSVMLPNGWVLILGTKGGDRPASLLYDPFTDAVHEGPTPLHSHAGGFAGVIADHAVLIAGGTDIDFDILSTTQNAEIFEWQ